MRWRGAVATILLALASGGVAMAASSGATGRGGDARAAAVCASHRTPAGFTLHVCPAAAPVGATVTVSSTGLCGAFRAWDISLLFVGPIGRRGPGDGGTRIPVSPTGKGFTAHFRIPVRYRDAQDRWRRTSPGKRYALITNRAACRVSLTVAAKRLW